MSNPDTVSSWYEQGATNYGFSLFSTNFVGSGYIAAGLFSSRNHGTSWSRPELEITYEGALPPIADADGPYSVVFGGSVMFDGRGSHDPDGGSITSWLWDLDADSQYDDATGQTSTKTWDYLVNTLHLAPGSHTIGLTVFDDESEWAVDTAQLEILPEPGNGDFDDDEDVDLDDFAEFQVCFGESPVLPGCEPGDMNGNNRIELVDYALFRAALEASGPK